MATPGLERLLPDADLMPRSCAPPSCCSPASSTSVSDGCSPDSNRSSAGRAATGASPPSSASTRPRSPPADEQLVDRDVEIHRVRRAGRGRTPTEKTPEVIARIEALMTHETAGDPVSGLKWTRRTTAKLADELRGLGIHVCPQTVARLLKAMGYSLRVNHKKLAGASHPNRNQQFQHITALRERCAADNSPLISVDTKKKELVGTFRNPGSKWDRSPEHRQRPRLPLRRRRPRRALRHLRPPRQRRHRLRRQNRRHPGVRRRLHREVVAHRGPQALSRSQDPADPGRRRWQQQLHGARLEVQSATSLLQPARLAREGSHYPPATSKWNPIEHRLFCEISKNWAGRPLDSFETILKYLRTTRTSTGLRVRAHLVRKTTRPASRSPTPKCESYASHRTASCPSGTTPSNPCDDTGIYFLRRP